jgi:hypothetical protein
MPVYIAAQIRVTAWRLILEVTRLTLEQWRFLLEKWRLM